MLSVAYCVPILFIKVLKVVIRCYFLRDSCMFLVFICFLLGYVEVIERTANFAELATTDMCVDLCSFAALVSQ